MAHQPPVPEEQRARGADRPDLNDNHRPEREPDPKHQGQGANTRLNTHRSGKTQDR